MTNLLEASEEDEYININLTLIEKKKPRYEESLKILATMITLANVTDQDQFVCSTQFDIEEPETYACTIQSLNSTKWAKVIEDKLNQLQKNKTWDFVHKNNLELGYQLLGEKWV